VQPGSKRKNKNKNKSKNNTTAEVEDIVSQVIAGKHGANLGHPTFLVLPPGETPCAAMLPAQGL
jgi:hypothetical protein